MTSTITEAMLALGYWEELSILGKATILLVFGLISVRLAGRQRASVRHLLLAVTFATLLVLPLIVVALPEVTIEVPVSRAGNSITASRAVNPSGGLIPSTSSGPGDPISESDHWSAPSWQI